MTVLGHVCVVSGTKRCVTIGGSFRLYVLKSCSGATMKGMGGGGEGGGEE